MTKVNIEISGDVGCGKSIVMYQIREMMFGKFGVDVKSPQLHSEMQLGNPDKPEDWQIESIRDTEWTMTESVNHSELESKMNIDKLETQSEEQSRRVKVGYEPVNTGEEIITYRNDIFFKHDSGYYISIENHTLRSVFSHMDNDNLFLRIETEITERDEFIQEAMKHGANKGTLELGELRLVEKMFDSGRYKLVDGE